MAGRSRLTASTRRLSRKVVRVNRVCGCPLLQLFRRLAEVLKNRPVNDFKRSIRGHHREGSGNAVDNLAKCEFVLHRFPLRSAFVDAENDQSTPTCPERIQRRPSEHPLGRYVGAC